MIGAEINFGEQAVNDVVVMSKNNLRKKMLEDLDELVLIFVKVVYDFVCSLVCDCGDSCVYVNGLLASLQFIRMKAV